MWLDLPVLRIEESQDQHCYELQRGVEWSDPGTEPGLVVRGDDFAADFIQWLSH